MSQIQTMPAGSMRAGPSVCFWALLSPSAYQFLFLAHSRHSVTMYEWRDCIQFHQEKLQWRRNTWDFLIEFLLSLLRSSHPSHRKFIMIIQSSLLPTSVFLGAFPKGGRWASYYRKSVIVRTLGLSQVSSKWLSPTMVKSYSFSGALSVQL